MKRCYIQTGITTKRITGSTPPTDIPAGTEVEVYGSEDSPQPYYPVRKIVGHTLDSIWSDEIKFTGEKQPVS